MKQRSPAAVLLLPFITFGIYSWYWAVKTKGEMNNLGEKIPTAWIWLIPIVGGLWWLWKYSEGVEHVTNEKMSGVMAFILQWLLGSIGQAILQDSFNKISPATAGAMPSAEAVAAPVVTADATATITPDVVTPQSTQEQDVTPPTPPTQPPPTPPVV